jgi:hypothetical protein
MWIRCKNCNAIKDFRNKRGNKISMCICKCGGKFERLPLDAVDGENPIDQKYTFLHHVGEKQGQPYFMAGKNSKGNLFILDRANLKAIPLSKAPSEINQRLSGA